MKTTQRVKGWAGSKHFMTRVLGKRVGIFLASLLVFGQTPCFSSMGDVPILNEVESHKEEMALFHVVQGDLFLIEKSYDKALESFEMASAFISAMPKPVDEITFLSTFGKAVAFDNLGMVPESRYMVAILFDILTTNEQEEADSTTEAIDATIVEDLQLLRDLADLALSDNIRSSLHTVVDEIEEELLSSLLCRYEYFENQNNGRIKIIPARRFWKKVRKFVDRVPRYLRWARKTLEEALAIKKALDDHDSQATPNRPTWPGRDPYGQGEWGPRLTYRENGARQDERYV